jgi:small subunit ribosomal protein S14
MINLKIIDKLHYSNFKDKSYRFNFLKVELKRNLLKNLCVDVRLGLRIRFFIKNMKLNSIKIKSISFLRSRCIITGRARFVLKFIKFSRQTFRGLASFGYMSGFKKN